MAPVTRSRAWKLGRSQSLTDTPARRRAPGPQRPDLKWDERLATHAQRWAECLIRHDTLQHDQLNTGEGENLFMVWGDGAGRCSFKQAVEAWNKEIVHYRGEKIRMGGFEKYGHYTQVCFIPRVEIWVIGVSRADIG